MNASERRVSYEAFARALVVIELGYSRNAGKSQL